MISPERVPGLIADLSPYLSLVCECQVIDFSKRAGYGPYLKTRIPDASMLDGFESGQRYHMLLIKIMEDEMPAAADPEKRKAYKLSQLAGAMCVDPLFWVFINDSYGEPCLDKDAAAQWVREACGVESRSFLDSNPDAGETFRGIMQGYDQWKQQHEGGA